MAGTPIDLVIATILIRERVAQLRGHHSVYRRFSRTWVYDLIRLFVIVQLVLWARVRLQQLPELTRWPVSESDRLS